MVVYDRFVRTPPMYRTRSKRLRRVERRSESRRAGCWISVDRRLDVCIRPAAWSENTVPGRHKHLGYRRENKSWNRVVFDFTNTALRRRRADRNAKSAIDTSAKGLNVVRPSVDSNRRVTPLDWRHACWEPEVSLFVVNTCMRTPWTRRWNET